MASPDGSRSSAPDLPAHYAAVRGRLCELAAGLTAEQADMTVPACPDWTVRDTFAHLAGSCSDILGGRLEGIATDHWTARQVVERSGRSLDEICREWQDHTADFDALLQAAGEQMDPRLYLDQWTHERDILGALSLTGPAERSFLDWCASVMGPTGPARAAKAGLPPLQVTVRAPSRPRAFGPDDASLHLDVSAYELFRLTTGRRSRAQMLALTWSGPADPEPYLDRLVVFTPSTTDIADTEPDPLL